MRVSQVMTRKKKPATLDDFCEDALQFLFIEQGDIEQGQSSLGN